MIFAADELVLIGLYIWSTIRYCKTKQDLITTARAPDFCTITATGVLSKRRRRLFTQLLPQAIYPIAAAGALYL